MEALKGHSTHWRATCSYPTHGVDYTDYVRGSFKDFDILEYIGAGQCKKVELINIRGHIGIQQTVKFWQGDFWSLHTDSTYAGCQFYPKAGSVREEDNFGHYAYVNSKFRCTAAPRATTQWWFGGHVWAASLSWKQPRSQDLFGFGGGRESHEEPGNEVELKSLTCVSTKTSAKQNMICVNRANKSDLNTKAFSPLPFFMS